MSRKFNFKTRDPWDVGYDVYKKTRFTINPGISVLVGCNGAGKTTLIRFVKDVLESENILYTSYDNLHDGGRNAMDAALHGNALSQLAGMAMSSEGEGININLCTVLDRVVKYIKSSDPSDLLSRNQRFFSSFKDQEFKTNEIWLLFDATDSGMSINSVMDLKMVLHSLMKDLEAAGKEVYILIAANEYEMCVGEECFDVQELKYRHFKSYDAYKKAILKSAGYKYSEREKAAKKAEETKSQKANNDPDFI